MHSVETVRATHEISGTLRRATDAAQLGHAFRLDAHLVHGVNDALRNRVVAATGAQSSFPASVIKHRKANPVRLRSRRTSRGRGHLLALHGHNFVGYGSRIQRQSVYMSHPSQPY